MANLPTPLERWALPDAEAEVWIKRDDLTGMELSGNKIRKLEFLLAEAKANGHQSVITVGGIQSNHCRATAVAARKLGLEPYIILRTEKVTEDPGMLGNLLLGRAVDANIRLAPAEGDQQPLLDSLEKELKEKGLKPYVFPSGGSNHMGTWGYIQMIAEMEEQMEATSMAPFDVLYFSCGSGGTGAGLALANYLSGQRVAKEIRGLAVDDSPAIFYNKMDTKIFPPLFKDGKAPAPAKDLLTIVDVEGNLGYAKASNEEMALLAKIAKSTAIVLDPVYTGKALKGMVDDMAQQALGKGKRIVYVHTGGLFGLPPEADKLRGVMQEQRGHAGWETLQRN